MHGNTDESANVELYINAVVEPRIVIGSCKWLLTLRSCQRPG